MGIIYAYPLGYRKRERTQMKKLMEKLEHFLELGGIKKDAQPKEKKRNAPERWAEKNRHTE